MVCPSGISRLFRFSGTAFFQFDMTYAWGYHGFGSGVIKRIAEGTSNANRLSGYITAEQNTCSSDHYRMYFTSNHDENSWHGTVFEQFGDAAETFGALTSLLPGMPLLYSGQEAGLDKRLLFFDKDQIEWRDHPFQAIYRTLFHLKQTNRALWNGVHGGETQRVATSKDTEVFAFIREKEEDKLFGAFNLSSGQLEVILQDTLHYDDYTNVFSGDGVSFFQDTTIFLTGWEYAVYEKPGEDSRVDYGSAPVTDFGLLPSYPNPFNRSITIPLRLPEPAFIRVEIVDVCGRTVRSLASGHRSEGLHTIRWDGITDRGVRAASGTHVVLVQVTHGSFESRQSQKIVLMK